MTDGLTKINDVICKANDYVFEKGAESKFIRLADNLADKVGLGISLDNKNKIEKNTREFQSLQTILDSANKCNKSEIARIIGCNNDKLEIKITNQQGQDYQSITEKDNTRYKEEPFIALEVNQHLDFIQEKFKSFRNQKSGNEVKRNGFLGIFFGRENDLPSNTFLFESKNDLDAFCGYLKKSNAQEDREKLDLLANLQRENLEERKQDQSAQNQKNKEHENEHLYLESDQGYGSDGEISEDEEREECHDSSKSACNLTQIWQPTFKIDETLRSFLASKLGNIQDKPEAIANSDVPSNLIEIQDHYKGDQFFYIEIKIPENPEGINQSASYINSLETEDNRQIIPFYKSNLGCQSLVFKNFPQNNGLLLPKLKLLADLLFLNCKIGSTRIEKMESYFQKISLFSDDGKNQIDPEKQKLDIIHVLESGHIYLSVPKVFFKSAWGKLLFDAVKAKNILFCADFKYLQDDKKHKNHFEAKLKIKLVVNLEIINADFSSNWNNNEENLLVKVDLILELEQILASFDHVFNKSLNLQKSIKDNSKLESKFIYQDKVVYLKTNHILPSHDTGFAIEVLKKTGCQLIEILDTSENDQRLCIKSASIESAQHPVCHLEEKTSKEVKSFLCTLENVHKVEDKLRALLPEKHRQNETIGCFAIKKSLEFNHNKSAFQVKFGLNNSLDVSAGFLIFKQNDLNEIAKKSNLKTAEQKSNIEITQKEISVHLEVLQSADKTSATLDQLKNITMELKEIPGPIAQYVDVDKKSNNNFFSGFFNQIKNATKNPVNKFGAFKAKFTIIYCVAVSVFAMCIAAFVLSFLKDVNSMLKIASTALVGVFVGSACYKLQDEGKQN